MGPTCGGWVCVYSAAAVTAALSGVALRLRCTPLRCTMLDGSCNRGRGIGGRTSVIVSDSSHAFDLQSSSLPTAVCRARPWRTKPYIAVDVLPPYTEIAVHMESQQAFRDYDFENDPKWRLYKTNLEVPAGRSEQQVLLKYKAKFYKQHVVGSRHVHMLTREASGSGTANPVSL